MSFALATSPVAAQFNNMAASVPEDANVLMLLSVDRILASPIAQRENWATKFEQAYAAGLTEIPTESTRVLVASQVDLEFLKPVWELAVLELKREPSLSYIAKQTKGQADKIGSVGAVALPNDTYLVQLTPNRIAAYSPANRQVVGRWLSSIKARSAIGLSPYLTQALDKASKGEADIVQAMDLEYSVPADAIRQRLDNSVSLKAAKVDLDKLASLISGIKGLILSVQIDTDVQGELAIDFADDTSMLATIGKPLLIEALEHRGAAIDDINGWDVKAQGTQLLLSGKLSPSGLRKVLNLVEQPAPNFRVAPETPAPADPKVPPPTEESLKVLASQQYFKSISSILRDCSNEYRTAETISKGALWLERFANRIDKLPMLNVDGDLIKYGQGTAQMLRSMAAGIRGSDASTTAQTMQVVQQYEAYGNVGFSPGYYGYGRYGWGEAYVQWNNVQGERTAIRAAERNKQAQVAIKGKETIANATQQIRAQMTERYKVEF